VRAGSFPQVGSESTQPDAFGPATIGLDQRFRSGLARERRLLGVRRRARLPRLPSPAAAAMASTEATLDGGFVMLPA